MAEKMKYYQYEGMPAYGLDGDCPMVIRKDGSESREFDLEAFGREAGFCPSCMGRRMAQTAANLMEHVLARVGLRQWVLTLPYPIRHRLAYNAKLVGKVTRAFSSVVLAFYKKRLGVSGCIAGVQRTSSDLKCNPHLHAVFLDGGYVNGPSGEPELQALAHLRGRDVADVRV